MKLQLVGSEFNMKFTARCFAVAAAVFLLPLMAWAEGGAWKINMKKADIRTFIEQVSDITGLSFVIDPRVKGEVTVVSNTEMTSNEIYDLFESVLRTHNFASIKSGNVVKIVPVNGAKQEDLPVDSGPLTSEKMVTRVIPVENMNATELVPILRPMVPQYGHLAAVSSANALIISDHATNISRIIEIIRRLDNAESDEVEVLQLKHAWVGDVVKTLEQLTPVATGLAKKPGGRSSGRSSVRVVAEERTNRLILRGEKAARTRIKTLLKDLDRPADSSGSTNVLYLRHAEAIKVAEIVSSLLAGRSATSGGSSSSSRSGSSSSSRSSLAGGRNSSSSRSSSSGGSSSRGSVSLDTGDSNVTIQADETLNALIIRAAPADLSEIREIVKQLDVRRAQVLIEAAFVEVSGNTEEAVGVQWGYGDNDKFAGGTQHPGGIPISTILSGDDDVLATAASAVSGLILGAGKKDGDKTFGAVIQAVQSNTNTNLLSTPSIMTLDNEEAEIIVGDNVPFVTGNALGSDNQGTFQTIERQDVGLTLRVTPQINDGDVVRLELLQEVSNVNEKGSTSGAVDLITSKRSVKSVILANDGEMIVTGGLIADDVKKVVSKVPLLGDIPLLGTLFRSTSENLTKRNLLLFLQPTIIRSSKKANTVSDEKYQKMRALSLKIDNYGNVTRTDESVFPGDSRDALGGGLQVRPTNSKKGQSEDAPVAVDTDYSEEVYESDGEDFTE